MLKKLIHLIVSVAALVAVAAPAAAQAEGPLITSADGDAADTITATSTNTTTVTSIGTTECATVTLHGIISENDNTTATGTGSGTAEGTVGVSPHTKHCGSSSGLAEHVLSVTISDIHLTKHAGETTGTVSFAKTYAWTSVFGMFHCTYTGTNIPVKKTGTDTISINGSGLVGHGPFACPETGTINGDFTILDENGEPVHIH